MEVAIVPKTEAFSACLALGAKQKPFSEKRLQYYARHGSNV